MTMHEARQRLEHERGSRLTQLRSIGERAANGAEELMLAQTAAIHRILAEITAAEERLAAGSYGVCQGCDARIAVERLEILPYVRNCVGCQQRAL
jgi:RNA polymerase-binding transcription factor DksA